MVVQTELADDEIDRIFHALAATTRRDILRRTIEREQSVSMLARDYDMSFAALSSLDDEAGCLENRDVLLHGRERLVRADPTMIARARALLDRFVALWRSRVDRLDALLAEEATTLPTATPPPAAGTTPPPDPGIPRPTTEGE